MKHFTVTLPIAGHAVVEVEADDEDAAIAKAADIVTTADIETWEALEQFVAGNVVYCPRPWTAAVVEN